MTIFAPVAPDTDTTQTIAQHRAETEQAIDSIRYDASIDDQERACRITSLVAEANRRTLALYAGAR